jgi:hypothetical protein
MATVSATRAASTLPVFKPSGGGALAVAWGTYTHGSNLAATTIIEYCRVPKGAVVVGGYWSATDLDTNGTEEIDIDVGWAGNGVDTADPDGFGNLDVHTGDVSVHLKVASIWCPLQGVIIATGPQAFAAETTLQAVINVDAATGGTGQSSLVVYYYVP